MAPKPRIVPLWVVGFDQRMFASPDKPIAIDDEESAGYRIQGNVLAALYLPSVLSQPTLQCRVEGLARISKLSMAIKSIDTLERRGHIFRQCVLWTSLELPYELIRERLVKLEKELVSLAHSARILSHGG